MGITLLGLLAACAAAACSLFILVHAFRRSVGTGVMTLLVPFFIFFYAFRQFEHRRKGIILAGWLLASGVAAVCYALASPSGPVPSS